MFSTILLLTSMALPTATAPAAMPCCPVIELRQYSLHPGKRDGFFTLFEREFIEPQEAAGITVIGQFANADNPDRFVWLRGFPDMPVRAQALQEFYGGPVWKAHRDEANENFTDTDNVLLLKPAYPDVQFLVNKASRPPIGTTTPARGMIVANILYFDHPASTEFLAYFHDKVQAQLRKAGIHVAAALVTDTTPNNFPRLPVREGEFVFVWLATYASQAAYTTAQAELKKSSTWSTTVAPTLRGFQRKDSEVLRLIPAPRSLLHG